MIRQDLDLSQLNLDGSHLLVKKGGESVTYQQRKRARTSSLLLITDVQGYLVTSTGIAAGNHHDAFDENKRNRKGTKCFFKADCLQAAFHQ